MSKERIRTLEIGEFSRRVGLPISTLHYYERRGLLSPARNVSGHRVYSADDVEWVAFVRRLKDTGMSIANIGRYATLRARGEATLQARMTMLQEHRNIVERELKRWQENLNRLDLKIAHYQELIAHQQIEEERQ